MGDMEDSAAGAATMKSLRRRRGLSLAGTARALTDLAAELHLPALPAVASVQRTVARWESKHPPRPDDRYQLLLAHLYARTPAGALALGPGTDFDEYLDALRCLGEGESRIADLRTAVLRVATDQGGGMLSLLAPPLRASLAAALADPARLDEETIAGLAAAGADVNRSVGSLPMVRLQLLLAPVVDAVGQLLAGPVPEGLLGPLRSVATASYVLAGRLSFETRDDAASRALYAAATREAAHLPTWRQAGVHMSHALTTMYAAPGLDSAQALADRAVHAASRGESALVRARAHALQAEISARSGRARQAADALRLAWYDMEGDHGGDPAATSFTASHLRGFEGVCELHAGDPAAAHDQVAAAAAALTGPREQVQRAIVITDQALARIRMGAPQDGAELLHECVGAAASTGGRVPAIRLRQARRELRPWRREDWVADLDDHLLDALGS